MLNLFLVLLLPFQSQELDNPFRNTEAIFSDLADMIRIIENDSISEPRDLNVGIPQGSVLGPILFCIYTLPLYELCTRNNILGL